VEIDPTIVDENIFVTDILSVDLTKRMWIRIHIRTFIDTDFLRPSSPGGICNIKTQLEPRWFTNPIPWRFQYRCCHSSLGSSGWGSKYVFLRVPIVFQKRRHVDESESDRKLSEQNRKLQQVTMEMRLQKLPDVANPPPRKER
jgi:hypothetical protein